MPLPIWSIALVVAATSPMLVRYVADVMEARVRRRTEALVAKLVAEQDRAQPQERGADG